MSLFKGPLGGRRYRVVGELTDELRASWGEALQSEAFREPFGAPRGEEIEGWVLVQNLLDTDFSKRERWLYNHYLVAALRVDRRVLPGNLVKALLERRLATWCAEHGRARAPGAVKAELREALEDELYARCLPRISVYEFVWNVAEGWALFLNASDGPNDRFRRRFHKTFGLELVPSSPLDLLDDQPELCHALEIAGASDLRLAENLV